MLSAICGVLWSRCYIIHSPVQITDSLILRKKWGYSPVPYFLLKAVFVKSLSVFRIDNINIKLSVKNNAHTFIGHERYQMKSVDFVSNQ